MITQKRLMIVTTAEIGLDAVTTGVCVEADNDGLFFTTMYIVYTASATVVCHIVGPDLSIDVDLQFDACDLFL
jgi:hypothetical protein